MSNLLKKSFTISVVIATIVWAVGIAAFVPVGASAATAMEGDLIKMDGNSSVYYYAGGKRYVFPNEATFFSWFGGFSGVKTLSAAELQAIPIGGNVVLRAGTKLVKITTDPKVYAVGPNGMLYHVDSEARAVKLYGANWASRVVDVPDAFFTNYTIGSAMTADTHPAGSLVKWASSADIFYINADGKKQKFASMDAFNANRFKLADVLTISDTITYAAGADITGGMQSLYDASQGKLGTVVSVGNVSVALASSTPASSTVVAGQATADLAHFTFSNGSSAEATVTKVVLKRTGVSSDTTLSNVYLFDQATNTRLTDSATVASGNITFVNASGLFTVPGNGSRVISVKSDILTGTSGQTLGVQLAASSSVEAGGAVSGSFPVSGNIMNVANATLAGVNFGSVTPASTDYDPANDALVWQSSVNVSNRSVWFKRLALREVGSINYSDMKNFRLFIDGVSVASSMALDNNGYVTFTPNSTQEVKTGSHTFKVLADLVGGSNRNFSFSVRGAYDADFVDYDYNVNVSATATGNFPASTGTISVTTGNVIAQKATDSPASTIVDDTSDALLAKYTLTAYGEPVKIETLTAKVTSSDASIGQLRNGRLVFNGQQYGNTAAIVSTSGGTAFTVNYTVEPGSPVTMEVRADIYDSDGTDNTSSSDTLYATLLVGASNAQTKVSGQLVNVPSASQVANTLTISTGTIALAKYAAYPDQTITYPRTAQKIGHFVLTGNSDEAVNINTISVDFAAVDGSTFTSADLSDVYVKYGSRMGQTKSTVSASSNTWSISETLAKNASLHIEIYANVGSTITSGDSVRATMTVSGTTVSSAQSVASAATAGQEIDTGSGSIDGAKAASSPVSQLTTGSATIRAADFEFTTTDENYIITEVRAKVPAAGATVVGNMILKDGDTVLGTQPLNSSYVGIFGGLSIPVAANSTKTLTVYLELGAVGASAGTSSAAITVTLDQFIANNSQGVPTTDTDDVAANAMYVYKALPTITPVALPTTVLTAGTATIAKFTVASNTGGTIGWKNIEFSLSKTSAPTLTEASFALYDVNDLSTSVGGTFYSDGTNGSTNTDFSAASAVSDGRLAFVATSEQQVSGSKTYVLKVTVGGSITTGHNISTSIPQGTTSYSAAAAYGSVAGAATFVWTDRSAQSHSTSTEDWNDNYLVKYLPTDSQVLYL